MQKRLKQAVKSKEKENGSKKRNQESAGDQQSMRKRAKLFMNGLESGTSKGIQRDPAIPDFQTASHLYKALKAFKLTSPSTSNLSVCFHGGHSIVADPTIDNTRRAALVARDISKLGGLSFNHKSTISPPVSSDRSCTLSFRCTCSVVQPVGEGSASMKMTLMNSWVSGQKDPSMKGKENGTTSPQMVYCKGVIEVTAEKDSSNPYMQGQRISIRIWH
ncbi:hypothetical protein VKT23_006823 [Stygiomarasmius scandens]|uniref:Uncharacterized protein n=1 Tax=Marasmiellus scandens TaxID=2682957 RepID=A0ABR1JM90_9AGAR